jgi:hypothetical protein
MCVTHTFRGNNASVPAGLNANLWGYEVLSSANPCSTQYLGSFNACNTALRSTRTINDICDHSSLYLNDCIACMLLSTLGTCRGYRMVVDAKLKHANS